MIALTPRWIKGLTITVDYYQVITRDVILPAANFAQLVLTANGLSGGTGCIWLCIPYLNAAGDDLALKWWGDAPTYDAQPTLQYARDAVAAIRKKHRIPGTGAS